METYQGYFIEQDRFIPSGTARIPLRRRTIVTILDEPALSVVVSEDVDTKLQELEVIIRAIEIAIDEEMPPVEPIQLREVAL